MKPHELPSDIAIVGVAATFAGAADVRQYWENILGKVDAVRDAPDSWAQPYLDETARRNDRIYTRKGGFLGELAQFDPREFGIMPTSVDGGEPDQYLALKLARAALRDAGYLERPFDRVRTGVILGRGTYVNRGYTNLMQHGLVVDQTLDLLRQLAPQIDEATLDELRAAMKSSLPPFTAETCPGMVPNVVSGRIANRLDLMGGNFIVDAACASSLIAVSLAMEELRSGRCDMMLTGGIHASTPPQIYMIFCQLGGLSRGDIRPFDAQAGGTLLGEGAGVMVLKRLADAERDGDRVYAVLKGVGTASDGKALGLLAPRLEGEATALKRAYELSGVDPATVGLVEAHGTGIPLGDQTEIKALASLFGQRGARLPRVAVGSVKSMIGHCIPAAGAAGIIKTALALYHKVLPPTLAAEVSPALGIEATPFYVNTEARPWIHGDPLTPRRAGVNAFGFGGINAHAVLEEYRGAAGEDPVLLNTRWATELVAGAAASRDALAAELDALIAAAGAEAPLWRLAERYRAAAPAAHRYAIVARSREDLARKARALRERLAAGATRMQSRDGIFYQTAAERPKTAFLFPGEGAQYQGMLADLCMCFPQVRRWFDFLDETFAGERDYAPSAVVFPPPTTLSEAQHGELERRLYGMDLGSELVFVASMALHELLGEFGVAADVMLGHSTGENSALVASGTVHVRDRAELAQKMREMNRLYLGMERDGAIPRGALLTVGGLERSALERVLQDTGAGFSLAMDNCPNQVVVFGPAEAMPRLQQRLAAAGGICSLLPFDRAYHTPQFSVVGERFRAFYQSLEMAPGKVPLVSCATGELFPRDPAAIRELAEAQWSRRVRFRETIERLYGLGVRAFVEVGPSANLTSFVEDALRGRDALPVATNSRRRAGLEQLQLCLARLFVHGCDVDLTPLYRGRARGDESEAPARPAVPLHLELPRVAAPAPVVAKIRERLGQGAAAPAPAAPPPEAAASAAPASAPADPRTAMLLSHFGLMQEFLDSQRRMLALLGGGAAHAPGGGAPRFPLLGRVTVLEADRLVAERRVSLAEDLYLADHTLGTAPSARDASLLPLPVVPFTFSMEMIAEAALRLAGDGWQVLGMEGLRGYRWLTVDRDGFDLRIEARRDAGAAGTYTVRVYQRAAAGPGGEVLVFEGRVRLGTAYPPAPPASPLELGALAPAAQRDEELYATGMFHGPRLRGVTHLRGWSKQGIEADLVTIATDAFFAGGGPVRFATDAGLLDAAGQLVGYWLSEQFGSDFNCFPFEVQEYAQYAPPPAPGQAVRCRGQIRFTDERQIEAHFDLLDGGGRVIARLRGWRDRYFAIPEPFYRCRLRPQAAFLSEPWAGGDGGVTVRRVAPFPDNFLEDAWGIWGRVLAHLVLGAAERDAFYALPEGRRRSEWLLGRIAAKDAVREWARARHGAELAPADVQLAATPNGRPVVLALPGVAAAPPEVSIAHSDGCAIAALAPAGERVGIDLQRLGRLRSADLLAGGFDAAERAALAQGRGGLAEDVALVAAWCAKEAAAKAAGTGLEGDPRRWRITGFAAPAREVRVERGGETYRVRFFPGADEMLALCLQGAAAPAVARA